MKAILSRLAAGTLVAATLANCSTAYDEYGQPRQVVEPGAAVAGALAIGLLAYALSDDGDDDYCDASRGYRYSSGSDSYGRRYARRRYRH